MKCKRLYGGGDTAFSLQKIQSSSMDRCAIAHHSLDIVDTTAYTHSAIAIGSLYSLHYHSATIAKRDSVWFGCAGTLGHSHNRKFTHVTSYATLNKANKARKHSRDHDWQHQQHTILHISPFTNVSHSITIMRSLNRFHTYAYFCRLIFISFLFFLALVLQVWNGERRCTWISMKCRWKICVAS